MVEFKTGEKEKLKSYGRTISTQNVLWLVEGEGGSFGWTTGNSKCPM